jgi:benzoylformate decarboxylase
MLFVPPLAAAAGKLAIIAGDEISTSNAAAELCFSPALWAHQSMGRPGRRTFRFLTAHPIWMGNLSSHAA